MTGGTAMSSLLLAAIPIDMNLLSRIPDAPVSITADGSQMTITEDELNFNTLVWHIPNFTSPDLIVPTVGATLAFDYTFYRAPGNAEIFNFELLGTSGNALQGFDLVVTESSSGTASFDLSSFANFSALGLSFEMTPDLDRYDAGLDSFLTIFNLRLESDSVPVPTPDAFGMLLTCLLALAVFKLSRSARDRLRINAR
jgi:hypothetical protein